MICDCRSLNLSLSLFRAARLMGVFMLASAPTVVYKDELVGKGSLLKKDTHPAIAYASFFAVGALSGVATGLFGVGGGVVKVRLEIIFPRFLNLNRQGPTLIDADGSSSGSRYQSSHNDSSIKHGIVCIFKKRLCSVESGSMAHCGCRKRRLGRHKFYNQIERKRSEVAFCSNCHASIAFATPWIDRQPKENNRNKPFFVLFSK